MSPLKKIVEQKSFSNGRIEISLSEESGLLSITDISLKMQITNVAPSINLTLDDRIVKLTGVLSNKRGVIIEKLDDDIGTGKILIIPYQFLGNDIVDFSVNSTMILKLYDNKDFCTLQLILDPDCKRFSYSLHSLSPFYIKSGLVIFREGYVSKPEDITFFEQGFQSWSLTKTRSYNEHYESIFVDVIARIHQNCDNAIESDYASETVTAISDKKMFNSVIIGFITLADCFNRISMNKLSEESKIPFLEAYSQFDSIPIKRIQMDPIKSEELFISFRKDGQGYLGLIKYAEISAKRMGVKVPIRSKTGWCSWYYYYEDISNSQLLKNVEFFEKNSYLPVEMIQLDDGYFTKVGDFTSFNEKFSDGLSEFVVRVHAQGKDAGLWIAPFFATETSDLFKEHPDWFLSSEVEQPIPVCYNWNEIEYALDLTKTEVQQHIRDLINTIVNTWGFDFIKIDFVYAASVFGSLYQEQGLTRAQVYRKGLRIIKDAMGEDKYLLGCGAPLGPSVGIVDAMRVSEDTKGVWITDTDPIYGDPCLKYALLSSIYRSFLHNHFWTNDPDCLIVRNYENSLTEDEIKLQLTVFALTAGQLLVSEDMTKLSKDRLHLALKVMPPYNESAIPIDALFESYPSLYTLFCESRFGSRLLVAVINWEDEPVTKEVNLTEILKMNNVRLEVDKVIIFDWWEEKIIGLFNLEDTIVLERIAPHSCKYLSVIPWENKDVLPLTSTIHMSQGCLEIQEYITSGSTIKIELDIPGKHEGRIFFLLKEGLKLTGTSLDITYLRISVGTVASIQVSFKDKALIHLNLE
ncbi:MAG: glycoside hydrolase family 36 protein [Candidatus Hodarchaeales archaeon]